MATEVTPIDEAAQALEAAGQSDVFDWTLSRKIDLGDKTLESLHIDLNLPTAEDTLTIEKMMKGKGNISIVQAMDKEFQYRFLAIAASQPYPVIMKMPVKDLSVLTMRVQNFLMAGASSL